MTIHAESEKVLNVPSILRVTVLMFFNVEYLRGDVFFAVKSANSDRSKQYGQI